MALAAGQMAGDYEILGVLGRGGMGRVYRVRNVISDRIEAMKVLLEDIDSEPGVGDRFLVEIRTLARFDHPGIAKFYAAFRQENRLLMVMEYVEGVDLAERAAGGAIPLPEVLGYIKQVLAALSYAHKRGVVHRDIKPSNIMVTPQGEVKLMDFGIAKSNTEPKLTRTGATMGSLLYMPPEQVRGTGVDARSDLYSLGIVLYELTAGCCPFDGTTTYAILDAQLNKPPRPPIELNPSLPSGLNDVILKALQKDPEDRFQNAVAFFQALEAVGTEEKPARPIPTAAPAPPPPPPFPQPQPIQYAKPLDEKKIPQPTRRPWLAVAAIVCACVLAAVLLGAYFTKSGKPRRRHDYAPVETAHNDVTPVEPPRSSLPSSTLPELSPDSLQPPVREKKLDNGDNQPARRERAKKTTPPQPPQEPISRPGVSFGGDRDVVSRGQSVTLRWSVTDATRVQILPGFSGLAPSGSLTVTPSENTQYTLLAEGPGGTATRQFSVRVQDLTRTTHAGISIVSFGADRQSILLGTSASLHWDVQGAARVMIVPGVGVVGASGTLSVRPARTTQYVLVASAADGSSLAQRFTVSVVSQQ